MGDIFAAVVLHRAFDGEAAEGHRRGGQREVRLMLTLVVDRFGDLEDLLVIAERAVDGAEGET